MHDIIIRSYKIGLAIDDSIALKEGCWFLIDELAVPELTKGLELFETHTRTEINNLKQAIENNNDTDDRAELEEEMYALMDDLEYIEVYKDYNFYDGF